MRENGVSMKIIFSLILITFGLTAFGKDYSVITDLDDTLKITNVSNTTAAIRNALFSKKAFKGMPELLKEMENYTNDTYILSASPEILSRRVDSFIDFHDLQIRDVYLRKIFTGESKLDYKVSAVNDIITRIQDDQLILIGDDIEVDADAYLVIKNENIDRVAAIYIHKVNNSELNENVIGYYTAYDIALNEYLAGRMSSLKAGLIGKDILLTKDLSDYFPSFAHCPKELEEFQDLRINILSGLTSQIRKKITKYCSSL